MKLPKLAHPGWADCNAFEELPAIARNLMQDTYYPSPSPLTFRAFEMNPLDVRVVIMGMSPYPSLNQYTKQPNACGYSFAVEDPNLAYRNWPPSLRVIFQDILNFETGTLDPTLSKWRSKGVMLTNAALTCLKENPESHLALWKPFTRKFVQYLSGLPGQRIWYFLGDDAKYYARYLEGFKDFSTESIHPARSARTGEAFDGQFKLVKRYYEQLFNDKLDYLQSR